MGEYGGGFSVSFSSDGVEVRWDPDKPDQVEAARSLFESAWRINCDICKGMTFDPAARRVLIPSMAGPRSS